PFPGSSHLALRSRLPPESITEAVRKAIRSVAPDNPIYDVRVMSDRIDDSVSGRRFTMHLLAFFGAIALLLAVIGIYGVLAFAVGQRTREIGVRIALGATSAEIVRRVVKRGLRLVLCGAVFGLAGAWVAGRLMRHQLFGVA